jgi:undecaprenyl-diphosphatase
MIDTLESIDRAIVLAVNSWNTPWLDEVMWWVSARITWMPLYAVLLYLGLKNLQRKAFAYYLLSALIAVVLADLISVHCFKEVFMRYRPSHNALLTNQLHFYEIKPGEFYKGGMYGFISSHAANFFALAMVSGKVFQSRFPKMKYYLLAAAILICFSRLYLGVHYLSDLIAGGFIGSCIGYASYRLIYVGFNTKNTSE